MNTLMKILLLVLAGLWLGLGTPVGAVGIWWGLLASLACASLTLGARLWWLVRKESSGVA